MKDDEKQFPYVATIDMVDQIVERCKMGYCLVKEVELEEKCDEVVRNYSARVLFKGQKGIDETLKITIYPYDKEKIQEAKEMYERLVGNNGAKAEEPIKKVNTVVLMDRNSNDYEEVAVAMDYLLARDIAVDFKNTISTKKVAIVSTDLYVDSSALNDYLNKMIVGTVEETEAVLMLDSPVEKLYAKSQAENKRKDVLISGGRKRVEDLGKQLEGEKEKNTTLSREVKNLCNIINEWERCANILMGELIEQREKVVELGIELKNAQEHSIKNIITKK